MVDIKLPEKHIQESKFLSIRDIWTDDDEAFELASKGMHEFHIKQDIEKSIGSI